MIGRESASKLFLGVCVLGLAGTSALGICWAEGTQDCCFAASVIGPEEDCGEEPCQNARVQSPTIDHTHPAAPSEPGQTFVYPTGSATCVIQPKHCVNGKCINNGGPAAFSCYSDIPAGANGEGPPPP
jgi:hypothetical protein